MKPLDVMSLAPRALLGALPAHAAISACEFQRDPAPMRPGPNADGIAAVPTLGEWSLLMLGTLLGLGGVRRLRGRDSGRRTPNLPMNAAF